MLQDMDFGRLENEFNDLEPKAQDLIVCIQDGKILLKRNSDDTLQLPNIAQGMRWAGDWARWQERDFRYVFRLHGVNYFLFMGVSGDCLEEDYHYESVRQLRQMVSKDICFAVMTAWHLYVWYRNNRFCGCCGRETIHDEKERMLRCPHCGNMIFPRISPAVIVAVTNGDFLLLTKYAGRSYTRYALIAGYTEIGETMEQTVQREVMEEVGLRVKNIRYYKSQPWGVDGNVLMGFYCDLDGENEIHLDYNELSVAEWHHRNIIPAKDDGISLTREMIRVFAEGREP